MKIASRKAFSICFFGRCSLSFSVAMASRTSEDVELMRTSLAVTCLEDLGGKLHAMIAFCSFAPPRKSGEASPCQQAVNLVGIGGILRPDCSCRWRYSLWVLLWPRISASLRRRPDRTCLVQALAISMSDESSGSGISGRAMKTVTAFFEGAQLPENSAAHDLLRRIDLVRSL